ncbi:YeeE/YedE family protein [Yoonia vestfoldensis]|uniref:YeeE/YedE family protein n=1 Tax=Yoonia vestfoldensis TaxID=245188 RepID=UPI000368A9CF|nr:YeeE/YedE family protein [Yoonia vestfoldensis]
MQDRTTGLFLSHGAQRPVFMLAVAALLIGAVYVVVNGSGRLAALWLVGAGLGFALYHAAFGFTGAYRTCIVSGRSGAVRAQMLMLAVAVLLFFPALAAGSVFGQPVRGFVFPAGWEVVIGAFLFGIGMQLGGGCASGTLYTTGGGDTRSVITLVFFVTGMTLGAWDIERWETLPALPPISLPGTLGLWPALALNLAVLAGIAWLLTQREKRRTGQVEPLFRRPKASFLSGPWPLAWAALALALLNFATLLIAGRPWGITQAFATWGSRFAESVGWADPVFWIYWEDPTRIDLLHRSLAQDATHLMNVGLVLGAFLAAGLAGRFAPDWRVGLRPLLAAVIGGLLLGYGARMAFGCNISAFFSGVASGSVHGWVWIAAAIPGNIVGIWLRPLFALQTKVAS